jgi:septal ring factor EnvC (AmiA/AmiB activator)
MPWMIVAAAVLLLALLLYVMFGAWLPAKNRITRLESELKDVYAREAVLQTRMAQQEQRTTQRDQQMATLRAEREALAKRIDDLERELTEAKLRAIDRRPR